MKILRQVNDISNKIGDKINNNQISICIFLIIISIAIVYFISGLSIDKIDYIDNTISKGILFGIITYLASHNMMIGVILIILIIVVFQIISNLKLNDELSKEEFFLYKQMIQEETEKINDGLEFETPIQYYNHMIDEGKILLSDSYLLFHELEIHPNKKMFEVAETARLDGLQLIKSGIGRLEESDLGELYLVNNVLPEEITLGIKWETIINKYKPDKTILEQYNNLKYELEILKLFNNNTLKFKEQLSKVLRLEFEILKEIFDGKKKLMEKHKINDINNLISTIGKSEEDDKKNSKNDKDKKILDAIGILGDLLV